MTTVISIALLTLFKLFPILNPPAMAPVFLEITSHVSDHRRNRMALTVSLYTFYLLTGLLLVGTWLLKLLGVSVDTIGISGGILLFHTAWSMLNRDDHITHTEKEEIKSIANKVFFPITIPMTAGPGAIAVTLAMVPDYTVFAKDTILNVIGTSIGIGLASIVVWIFYRFSGPFLSRLGKTAKLVIGQISAFILLAIGVQLIWTSLSHLIKTL